MFRIISMMAIRKMDRRRVRTGQETQEGQGVTVFTLCFFKAWSYFSLFISRLKNAKVSQPSIFNIMDLIETGNIFTGYWG